MRVWLVIEGEELPSDGENVRLLRMGILADMLVKRGHEVIWWASTFSHARKVQRFDCDTVLEISERYTIRLLHARPYQKNISFARIKHQKEVAKRFFSEAQAQDKPDVILVGMPTIDLANVATKYGKLTDVPVIIDLRDLWPDAFFEYFPKVFSPFLSIGTFKMNRRLHNTLLKADALIGITEPILKWGLRKCGRSRNAKDAVFPLGYPRYNDDIQIDKNNILSQLGLSKHQFIIIFSGAISNSSNLKHVIDTARAMRDEKDIVFVLMGSGDKLECFRSLASNLPNVRLPGRLSKYDLAVISSIASAGIIPYKKKTQYSMSYPNKFAEYLFFGLPVLLYTDGLMLQTINEYNCGFPYDTSAQMAISILKLKNTPDIYIKMKENARILFEQEFDADQVYCKMIDYLENFS